MSNFTTNYKVTCDFLGRLGNNLFQAAAVVGYAEKYGCDYAIPLGYHHTNIYRFFPKFKYQYIRTHWPKTEESECRFIDLQFNPNGTHLRGFFQSERYFAHCKDKILDLLSLRYDPIDFVSIHVRRTDYLEYPANFTTAHEPYLNQAMDRFGDEKFLVFSDDIAWCKETFPTTYPKRRFEFVQDGNEYNELSLMSSCKHNIIGASSFSWWGSWANRNPEKIVISPSKETWFGVNAQQLETENLIPSEWIQIPAR